MNDEHWCTAVPHNQKTMMQANIKHHHDCIHDTISNDIIEQKFTWTNQELQHTLKKYAHTIKQKSKQH